MQQRLRELSRPPSFPKTSSSKSIPTPRSASDRRGARGKKVLRWSTHAGSSKLRT